MNRDGYARAAALAVDVDAAWLAWTAPDRVVRVGDFSEPDPRISTLAGIGADQVLPGFLPGTFLLLEGDRVVRWNAPAGRTDGEVGAGPGVRRLLDLDAGPRARHRFGLVAATGEELLGHADGRWHTIAALDGPPLALAWQHRRRSVLVLTGPGTLSRLDPVTGEVTQECAGAVPSGGSLACYDEVLGGVWVTSGDGSASARFVRVEPWPPREVYRVDLPGEPVGLGVSHSGEWLVLHGGAPGTAWLYNVNGRTAFTPPPAVAERCWPAAFTYTNRLVAVDGDDVEITEIPARADIRAPRSTLDIDTFWESAPRMHRAVSPNRG